MLIRKLPMPWLPVAVALLASVACPGVAAQTPAEPAITWRLENPFRFFTDPAHTEVHRATYLSLSEIERQTPVLAAERALSERHNGEGWAQTMLDETCWSPKTNRHSCASTTDYMHPASHRVIVGIKGVEDTEVDCVWLTSPKGRGKRGASIKSP